MKFILKINNSTSPKAAYVGWAPVKCTLTVDRYSGNAPLPVTIATGDDGLDGKLSLYASSAISALPVAILEHDFQSKGEITFYVAGKFPHASVAKKDTFIHISSNGSEVPELRRKVMVRVRKNANRLTDEEIRLFLESFVRLNNAPAKKQYTGDYTVKPAKLLHEIVLMHTLDAAYEIHMRTSFHPWHRAFQMHLERELQQIDARVTIPYWKFDEKAERVFTAEFIGETKKTDDATQGVAERLQPGFAAMNPLVSYAQHTVWGPLRRAYRSINPAIAKPQNIYTETQIINGPESSADFLNWSVFEERRSHNQAHNTFTGHVVDIGRDPVDPLFFMMHGNVDRLWALWQQKHNRFDSTEELTYPFQNKYMGERGDEWAANRAADEDGIYGVDDKDMGNFAEDTLWPWDADIVLSRPMRKWTSANPNYGTGAVPQINIDFPDSATSNYPQGPLTVKSTIDYQGRIHNLAVHGFDYDHIPYFDHDKTTTISPVASTESDDASSPRQQETPEMALDKLFNKQADVFTRLQSLSFIDESSEAFLDVALAIIADVTEPEELRSALIHQVFTAKRMNRSFASRKPRFFDILRGLLTDASPKLRFQAIDILSAGEDAVVQDFLIEQLQKDRSEFISKTDAIFFLRQNTRPQHAALFRQLLEQSVDPEVRKAAVEGLDNDPDSVDLLKKVVLDTNESFKVREAGAFALHHIDHETMNDLAAQMIAQPATEPAQMFFTSDVPDADEVNFKTGLLNMLTFTGDINRLKQNEALKTSLQQVAAPDAGNSSKLLNTFEVTADETAPTPIAQMAATLLNRFEESDDNE